ncbi:MAG: transposase [Candidatus Competibacteraceae bacterium]|nr:transposase [Candidatus Competibacteraceae bacterium]
MDRSKMSKDALKHFSQLFTEAKWFYNYCLGLDNVNDADTTTKVVPVKVGEQFEDRPLKVLTGQMKQSLKTRLFGSLSALKSLKQNGHRIGRLKFKGRINSIPLKQLGGNGHSGTYYIDRERSRVKVQGWKPWIRVGGLHQIPADAEIANAVLVRKANNFYFNITTFIEKQERVVSEESIGIDFGCQTQLTFSNGIKAEFQVSVSKKIRRFDRKIKRKDRPDSKKKRQDQLKRQREYQHLTNKKKDIRNKIVNAITNNFRYVCFQDESIHAWHAGNHGRKIQNSGIGGIISDLKHKSATPLEVSKFFPSTKLCPQCDQLNKLYLGDRTYICDCGFSCDRDIKSAQCIEAEAMKAIPTDGRDFKTREISTSTFFDILSDIGGVKVSKLESMN